MVLVIRDRACDPVYHGDVILPVRSREHGRMLAAQEAQDALDNLVGLDSLTHPDADTWRLTGPAGSYTLTVQQRYIP